MSNNLYDMNDLISSFSSFLYGYITLRKESITNSFNFFPIVSMLGIIMK